MDTLLSCLGAAIVMGVLFNGWPTFITINKHYHYDDKKKGEDENV